MNTRTAAPVIEHVDYFEVAKGVWGLKDIFVNIYMIENPIDNSWVLVDTGLKSSFAKIKKLAAELFGADSKPACIILTHGHFDHIGSIKKVLLEWKVPVYAHPMELPYLTGLSAYPPPDSTVGGGMMSSMAWLYPKKSINLTGLIHPLPENGDVPFLWDWKYLHTPGHTPGHISLFRSSDKTLIAGDAVTTTKPESVLSVMFQTKVVSGPPKYFTYDWVKARESVNMLADLEPEVLASGHGRPMEGEEMRKDLRHLCTHFFDQAVPGKGRYIPEPAVADLQGVQYVPPVITPVKKWIVNALMVGAAFFIAYKLAGKKKRMARY